MLPNMLNPVESKRPQAKAEYGKLILEAGHAAQKGQDKITVKKLTEAKHLADIFDFQFSRRSAAKLLLISAKNCSTHCTIDKKVLVQRIRAQFGIKR